jgi:hypothetical protein
MDCKDREAVIKYEKELGSELMDFCNPLPLAYERIITFIRNDNNDFIHIVQYEDIMLGSEVLFGYEGKNYNVEHFWLSNINLLKYEVNMKKIIRYEECNWNYVKQIGNIDSEKWRDKYKELKEIINNEQSNPPTSYYVIKRDADKEEYVKNVSEEMILADSNLLNNYLFACSWEKEYKSSQETKREDINLSIEIFTDAKKQDKGLFIHLKY